MQAAKRPEPVCGIELGTSPAERPEGAGSVSITIPSPSESNRAKTRALGDLVPYWYQAALALVLFSARKFRL